jgi:CheY-like chemotaxis protein
MGGTIEVASALGSGSTFTLDLPLQLAATKSGTSASEDSLKDCALLAIAANPLTQSVLRALLGPHFRHVEIVPSLDAAAASCRNERFALVVADGPSLPGDDGDLGAALVRLAGGRGRVLILNDRQARDLSQVLDGFAEILDKPIGPASLLSKLADMQQATQTANLAATKAA